jgi:hypothetical protein
MPITAGPKLAVRLGFHTGPVVESDSDVLAGAASPRSARSNLARLRPVTASARSGTPVHPAACGSGMQRRAGARR